MCKVLDRLCDVLAVVAALLLLFITISISYSIFARLVGIHSPIWTVQMNEYALLWLTFLGAAWLLSRDKHVSIHLVFQRLGNKSQKVMGLVHSIMGAVLCGALCWFGIFTTWGQFERKVIDVQSIDVPKAYVLVVIPLGFLLLFLQFARKFIAKLRETETTVNQAPMEADNAGPDSSIDMETSSTR